MGNIYFKDYDGALAVWKSMVVEKRWKTVNNNTRVVSVEPQVLGLKLHDTIIVYYYRNGGIKLDSGGFRTLTTKERINSYTPFYVYQENHIWYVKLVDKTVIFQDGIYIDPCGIVVGDGGEDEDTEQKIKERKKLIREYVNGFVETLPSPLPDKGDCWYCALINEEGKPLGDVTNNVDHLWSHIEEEYYVPALLWNAFIDGDVTERFIFIHSFFKVRDEDIPDYAVTISKGIANKFLTRYLQKRLLFA